MQKSEQDPWWIRRRDDLLEISREHLNAYVYDLLSIEVAAKEMLAQDSVARILYAVKANFNQDVLRTLASTGVDFDCVSPGEVDCLRAALGNRGSGRVLFTPNFAPREEYEWAIREGLRVTLDNLYPLGGLARSLHRSTRFHSHRSRRWAGDITNM